MERPETQYAWNGDSALAYQVLGDGDSDLLFIAGMVSNVELNWNHPTMARFLRGLARGRRLIVTDMRGVGCSERCSPHDIWQLETVMEDMAVVLDACQSKRAAILATQQCAFAANMFAATYPERTTALVLHEASANWRWSEETPWEWRDEQFDEDVADIRRATSAALWDEDLLWRDPSMADDHAYAEWWRTLNLLSVTPGSCAAMVEKYTRTDIRGILASIHVPVLVLTRRDHHDQSWAPSARFLAERIAGARHVELEGRDLSLWVGDQASVLAAIDTFLGEVRREEAELERILATVLFTDIVGSTEKLAELGNAGWRDLAERHHARVRALLERFRGTEVDTAGDGFFASFDGPARAIRCAQAIVDEVRPLGIEVRAGLHTGECELIDGKVGGMAVNIGARVGSAAGASEVLVSQTVKDLVVGSGLAFEDRGEHELKGVDGPWRLYRVVGASEATAVVA
jgi:class 3 adenylate cyclase